MNFKNAARELGAAGHFSAVDQEHLVPLFETKLKSGTPESRNAWVQFFDELGEEVAKHASHPKLGHELLKFASDLKYAPGDTADRALHRGCLRPYMGVIVALNQNSCEQSVEQNTAHRQVNKAL